MPTNPYWLTQRSISARQLLGRDASALRQHRHADEVLRKQRADAVDQLVAGGGPGFAGPGIAEVVAHAGRARGKDRQVGAALALHLELAADDGGADLVIRHARARRRRLAGLVRLDLLGAPRLVLTRGSGVMAVTIDNHRNSPHLEARQTGILLRHRFCRSAMRQLRIAGTTIGHNLRRSRRGSRRRPRRACRARPGARRRGSS